LICFASLPSAAALADAREPGDERGGLVFAAFDAGRNTDAGFDSASRSNNGSDIDLEDDLGLERTMTVGRLSGYVWLTPRQRIDFSLFDLSREANKSLDEDLVVGDATFAVDANVHTANELKIYKLDYTFVPLSRERGFLGVVAGLYVARSGLSLDNTAGGASESRALTAPLPVFGLRGEYAFGDRITVRGASELFEIQTGGVGGHLHDTYVGADYSFGKRFAVGIAYNDVGIKISAEEKPGFQGLLDAGYSGALLYFKVDFGATR
jgi:hypothetical protein